MSGLLKQTSSKVILSLLFTGTSLFSIIGCSGVGQGSSPGGGRQAPTITTQPANQTATAGQTATFSVVASGTAPLSYQWQKNGASITGATSSSYTTPPTTATDNGSTFRVVVSNSAGTATSNMAMLTVTADTTPPTISITAPVAGATVSGTVTVSATAGDNVGVASVQFQLDGVNLGILKTASPYSISWDTTTASNGSHTLTALAKDAAGNSATSSGVTVTVSNVALAGMGPLVQSATNSHYFVNPSGQVVLLAGSHTWNDFQDTDTSSSPAAFDFNGYVTFLKSHGHNATILWRKDLPTYCNWGAGGTWHMSPFPWKRTGGAGGTQVASDGLLAFDLTQLDQTYFDRLRSRVILLQQNGIYAIVELFDGLGLADNRCSSSSCGIGTPACKVNINDSDHSYFGMWNDTAAENDSSGQLVLDWFLLG